MISCRLQAPPNPEQLNELDIRLIVPDRPGYGKSSHKHERNLLDWADDFEQLINHLKLDQVYIAGYSAGGPHAAACAYRFPERCIRVGLISTMWPFETLKELNGMRAGIKMVLALARHSPVLLMPFIRIMAKSIVQDPADYIKRLTCNWSASDTQLIENPNIMNEMSDCFKEVIRNGTEGLFSEHFLIARLWGFKLKDIKTETITWHGEADTIVPFNFAQNFSQIPNNHLVSYPDEGHLLIVNHWQETFKKIIQ